MNILLVISKEDNEYKLKDFLTRVLYGDVKVNLDGYFPLRTNPEEDYLELDGTKGRVDSHTVVITSPFRGKLIKKSYLETMDLVVRGTTRITA